MERKRGEKGERCGKQGLLEGVVGRQVDWQHLWLSPAPEVWDLLPTWRTTGIAKLLPAAHHEARALPRASIRLVPLHAKHGSCSTDEGLMGSPLQQHCWFPQKHLPVTHMETALVPTVRRNPQSLQAFFLKFLITLFFLEIAC